MIQVTTYICLCNTGNHMYIYFCDLYYSINIMYGKSNEINAFLFKLTPGASNWWLLEHYWKLKPLKDGTDWWIFRTHWISSCCQNGEYESLFVHYTVFHNIIASLCSLIRCHHRLDDDKHVHILFFMNIDVLSMTCMTYMPNTFIT